MTGARPATLRRILAIGAAVAACLASHAARAEHDHQMMSENHQEASAVSAGVAVTAARYDNALYLGSYQAITPSVGWLGQRFGASATLGLYHLTKNGLSVYGAGDAMVSGHATVFASDALQTGVALHMMFPTGSERDGLGMGHTMAMPSAWATWRAHPVTLRATAGYGRALVSLGGSQHDHGPSPLVDPMNLQELTWSAGADVAASDRIRVGGRAQGAMPIGHGTDRVVGAGRVAWGTPRVSTAFEVQLGLAGDPFTVRGVVETALRF